MLSPLLKRLYTSSLVRSSSIYTISNFINAAIPFILLPILTKKLSPVDYGVIAMFQIAVSIVYPFMGLNLEGSIQRKYFDNDNTHLPTYIGNSFLLFLLSSLIVSSIFWIFFDYIKEITQIPGVWLKYILLVAASQFIVSVILILFQVRIQPLKYGVLQISQSLINVILTILLVVVMNRSYMGRLESQIYSAVIIASISLVILFRTKQIKFTINKIYIQHALKFGVPLIPHAIGGMLFIAIDRFFLTNLVGLEQTGNYTVAFQLGAIVSLITLSFNNAFVPWLFENLNKDDQDIKRKIVKFTYLYFILLILGAIILLGLFPIIVIIFVDPKFNSVNIYSAFIVFGFVFQGMYFMVTNYITYAEKTYLLALVTISVALLKIPITYFAILSFGAIGASISYCITFFIFFIATWTLSAKVYNMPWFYFFSNHKK